MRLLSRNKMVLWYANRSSASYVTDNNGLKTGEIEQAYTDPVKTRMSIDGAEGNSELVSFGITANYGRKAVTDDMACTMNEESIVWLGIEPTHTETRTTTVNGETVTEEVEVPNPHNFTVIRRTDCLTHIIFYLKEVDASC